MSKLPNFTLRARVRLERDAERTARQGLAEATRFAARAENQARLLAMLDKRRGIEVSATIGRVLAQLDVRGWKRALLALGVKDSDFLERCVELSNTQLQRFITSEAPAVLADAEVVARAIEAVEPEPSVHVVPHAGLSTAPRPQHAQPEEPGSTEESFPSNGDGPASRFEW